MPYIKPVARERLAWTEDVELPDGPGELNYAITRLIDRTLTNQGEGYGVLNEIVGALECCKLELNRRVIGSFEDSKIAVNGDVYFPQTYN